MSELVADCPRCGSKKMTFDLKEAQYVGLEYGWKRWYETFCVCRHCGRATTFVLSQKEPEYTRLLEKQELAGITAAVNNMMDVNGHISLKDMAAVSPPEHVPDNVAAAFREGATALAVGIWNAAGTMFRLCVDLATREKLPPEGDPAGPNAKTRRDLGLRLPWLFDSGRLPQDLRELSGCIKEDGNDGAHAGTLTKADAEDLLDFTVALLERTYTEPERVRLAGVRRDSRRAEAKKA